MKRVIIFSIVLIVPFISALKCEEAAEVDPDSPSSLCDHVFGLCGDDFMDGDKKECMDAVRPLDSCRKECAADQKDCDAADQCLFWNLGYDGEVDDYCSGSGGEGEGEGEGEGNGNGNYSSLEECAASACTSANNTCQANPQCTGIFDDCLAGCTDWACVDICASIGYSGGIDDFNTLWTCLSNNCSSFIN